MRSNRILTLLRVPAFLALVCGLAACDAESPTAPTQQPVAPVPNEQPASATWVITISADPDVFNLADEEAQFSNITVVARRASNGAPVPLGTTALLKTTAGQLTTADGVGTSVPIVFDNTGTARATLTLTSDVEQVVVLRAQIENSYGSLNINVVDIENPFLITAIDPISGPPSGGTPITIFGRGFEEPVRATFSVLGQTLFLQNVRVQSSTRITATTPAIDLPAGQNATASLTLQNAFGSTGSAAGTDTVPAAFTYTRNGGGGGVTTLKVFSITPTSGPNEGGTRVAITGEGFGSQMQVFLSNAALVEAQITSLSSTRIEIVTPAATGQNAANANQRVDIRVNDLLTGATATLAEAFQYGADSLGLFISSISPAQGEYLGGDLVTIYGQGFEEPVAVGLGGFGQQIVSVTGTQIVVRTVRANISCASVSAPTAVTNLETNERITNGPAFSYLPILPVIVSVSPQSGPQGGGNQITILGGARSLGRGFVAPVRVLINDQLASIIGVSGGGTQITVQAPPFTGTIATTPCIGAGGVAGTQNVPTSVTVEVINLDTGCTDSLDAGYTYIPADQSCQVATAPGGGGTTPLAANFTAATDASDATLAALQVRVTDTSTGSPTAWLWNFGDGSPTSNVQSPPVHTYPAPGSYIISLTVNNGSTNDQVQKQVNVD
jgi:hypothetical protein